MGKFKNIRWSLAFKLSLLILSSFCDFRILNPSVIRSMSSHKKRG